MPTARSANEREVSSRLCATRQGDSHQYWYQPIDCIRIFEHPLTYCIIDIPRSEETGILKNTKP
jgi:hypothetical protein